MTHVPVWYGDRWDCPCGKTFERDIDAFFHYAPPETHIPPPASTRHPRLGVNAR